MSFTQDLLKREHIIKNLYFNWQLVIDATHHAVCIGCILHIDTTSFFSQTISVNLYIM